MPKPQKNTPVAQLISLFGALTAWYSTYANPLKDGLDGALNPATALLDQGAALIHAQTTFEREQKEDVAASIQIDGLMTQGVDLLSSISKVAQAALRNHPQRPRLARQLLEAAPSSHRTAPAMIDALTLACAGLKQHAELFQSREALCARILLRAEALIDALTQAQTQRKQEHIESRAASVARNAAFASALDLLTTLDDAAQAVYFETPEPYTTLRVLYEVHCPTSPAASRADRDATDPPEDPA